MQRIKQKCSMWDNKPWSNKNSFLCNSIPPNRIKINKYIICVYIYITWYNNIRPENRRFGVDPSKTWFFMVFFLVIYIRYIICIYVCTKPHADRRNNKNLKNNSMNVFNSFLLFFLAAVDFNDIPCRYIYISGLL